MVGLDIRNSTFRLTRTHCILKLIQLSVHMLFTASLIMLKSLMVMGPMLDKTSINVGLLETQPSRGFHADMVTEYVSSVC
jgi:hypothetical protein